MRDGCGLQGFAGSSASARKLLKDILEVPQRQSVRWVLIGTLPPFNRLLRGMTHVRRHKPAKAYHG
jgi:hypothetical protein